MNKGLNPCDMKDDSDCLKIQKYIIDLLKEPVADYMEDEDIHPETVSVTDFIITNPKSLSDFINEFRPSWEQPDNALFDTKTINKLQIMQRNEYIKSKANKVNTYVEFSGRQTGKTTRLIQRALLESYQNNVVIFVNKLDTAKNLYEKIRYTISNISVQSFNGDKEDKHIVINLNSTLVKSLYNKLSNKSIYITSSFDQYLHSPLDLGGYSFFFEEAAFNSNIGFLSHKEILENIAPNGLLYFSGTLNNFLQKKSPVVTDFQEDPMQFLYEEFGIDVNFKIDLKNFNPEDYDAKKLEEGYLFKTVGQTIYE